VKPDFVPQSDWIILEKYGSQYNVPPELIAAIGWQETNWGQKGAGRDGYILGVGVPSKGPRLASAAGIEQQLMTSMCYTGLPWIASLSMYLRRYGGVNYNAILAFVSEVHRPDDPATWAQNVWSIYQSIESGEWEGSGTSQESSVTTRGSLGSKPEWFNPTQPGKCYFTKPLRMDRQDDLNSEINPAEYTPEDIVNLMHYNDTMYDKRGRLVQAFPTFLMMFIDEGEWVGGRKLWNNFYFYHSMVSLDIVKERGNPADLAYMELTNVYGALNHYTVPPNLTKLRTIQRLFPAITQHSLEMRRQLFKDLMIRPGARVHIRMGYSSQASGLPVVFNGTIVEVDAEEMATFVAQGDGHELLNEMLNFGPDDKTSFFNTGTEPTSIISRILAKRGIGFHLESNMLKNLIGRMIGDVPSEFGKGYSFGASSPYGIEHFGTVKKPEGPLVWGNDVATFDVLMNVYSTNIKIGELNKIWRDYAAQKSPGTQQPTQDTSTEVATNESEEPDAVGMLDDTSDAWEGIKGTKLWKMVEKEVETKIQEAVRGIEHGLDVLSSKWEETRSKIFGERNIGVWLGKKTPWDIFSIIAKCTTGYIISVVPFQFRSTFFFGLPWWPMCIKYKWTKRNVPPPANTASAGDNQTPDAVGMLDDTGAAWEGIKGLLGIRDTSKDKAVSVMSEASYECVYTTLQQFYTFSSHTDILYNSVKASARDIATNVAAIYTLGGKAVTSPVVMADWTIRADLQKTDLVDSGTVQDIIGPDMVYHYFGERIGEDRAIIFAQSHLVEKMRNMYKDNLIVRGTPSVKPYDLFYLDDTYTCMFGLAEVGKVVHSISPQTGFISMVKPDLITRHIELTEQWNRLYTHAIAAGTYVLFRVLRFMVRTRLTGGKFMEKMAVLRQNALQFAQKGKAMVTEGIEGFLNKFRDVEITADASDEVADVVRAAGMGGKLRKAMSIAGGFAKVARVTIVPALVEIAVFGLIDGLLQSIEKVFTNMNKVKIYPLMLKDKYFVAGITGSKNLVAFDEGSNDTKGSAGGSNMEYINGTAGQQALPNGMYLGAPSDRAGTVTSVFDELREPPKYNKTYRHKGVDIAFYPNNAPITAVQAGTAAKATYDAGYGNYVVIDHGENISTLYAHLSSINVSVGSTVKAGQVIGYQGNTGNARGPHLHIELIINGQQMNILPYLPPLVMGG